MTWLRGRSRNNDSSGLQSSWWTRFTFNNILDTIDLFKLELPNYNLRGRQAVSSVAGGIVTVAIFTLMMLYANIKFFHFLTRYNPNISSHLQTNYFSSEDRIDLKENNLRFAFIVEGYQDEKVKDDPAYVKYLVRMFGKRDGVRYEKLLDYHKCSKEELDNFN